MLMTCIEAFTEENDDADGGLSRRNRLTEPPRGMT